MATIKSIEEKAKAYDEALKVLHKYDGANIMFTQDLKEEMFPELKESEDERIRKSISAYFAKFKPNDMWDADFSFGDIVAWLEKQGNNMGISEATKQKLEDNLNNALEKETPKSCNEFLDWQGEQKLYVNDNAKEMFIKALERVEEQNNKGYKLTDCDKNSWWEDFKAYTSCTIEQKPAAWSDEDEKQARQIERIVHDDGCTQKLQKQIADWFKSLKERYTWKPSERQKEALLWCVVHLGGADKQTLGELLEALNKLQL